MSLIKNNAGLILGMVLTLSGVTACNSDGTLAVSKPGNNAQSVSATNTTLGSAQITPGTSFSFRDKSGTSGTLTIESGIPVCDPHNSNQFSDSSTMSFQTNYSVKICHWIPSNSDQTEGYTGIVSDGSLDDQGQETFGGIQFYLGSASQKMMGIWKLLAKKDRPNFENSDSDDGLCANSQGYMVLSLMHGEIRYFCLN